MRIWLARAALLGIPIFVGTLVEVTTGSHPMIGGTWVGLIVPPALVLFGTVLPKVGRLLGKNDRTFVLEHTYRTRWLRALKNLSRSSIRLCGEGSLVI